MTTGPLNLVAFKKEQKYGKKSIIKFSCFYKKNKYSKNK